MAATKKTRLFWSERGGIACSDDTPYKGSDTWRWERWRPMTPREIDEYTTEVGKPPCCECCRVQPDGTINGGR